MARMNQPVLACALLLAASGSAAADRCVAKDASVDQAQLTDKGVVLCTSDAAKTCWTVDLAAKTWTAQAPGSMPADPGPAPAAAGLAAGPSVDIDDKHTTLKACSAPGTCTSIPVTLMSPDSFGGVAAVGATTALVWDHAGVQVFDIKTGKKVATIKAQPAFKDAFPDLQGVDVLPGDDETIDLIGGTGGDSSVATLYQTRTGKLLHRVGIVERGYPSSIDEGMPFVVAPHQWGFIEFEHGRVFVHDVRTGALVRSVDLLTAAQRKQMTTAQGFNMMGRLVAPMPGAAKPSVVFVPAMPAYAPVTTADLTTGKLTAIPTPVCK
jgi:hypothetical protein